MLAALLYLLAKPAVKWPKADENSESIEASMPISSEIIEPSLILFTTSAILVTAALTTFNTFEGRNLNNFEDVCETVDDLPGEELDDGQGFTILDLLNKRFCFFFLVLKLADNCIL